MIRNALDKLGERVQERVQETVRDQIQGTVRDKLQGLQGRWSGDDAPSGFGANTIADPELKLGEVKLTGNRKALLVGINYIGQKGQLNGCINDCKLMKACLNKVGFPSDPAHEKILIEDQGFDSPTRRNILEGLSWLVAGAKPGDSLFFHYSGHGTRTKDLDGDEEDGYDEAICPVDFDKAGLIIDDDLFDITVKPLPRGCRLTILMDCCHSGSAFDLPYNFIATPEATMDWKRVLPTMILGGKIKNPWVKGIVQAVANNANANRGEPADGDRSQSQVQVSKKFAQGEVVMISGCQDTQTSADIYDTSQFQLPTSGAGGACTHALISVLANNKKLTFVEVLEEIRATLKNMKMTQIPQLSSTVVSTQSTFFFFFFFFFFIFN
eukprot:GHVO01040451.1.p1 GENE.GHVO01040451.1~~GHVO01040451.1.p1  ORF type:complete len:382 (+),score=63.42 GHVO01040451.1:37-1182(+)